MTYDPVLLEALLGKLLDDNLSEDEQLTLSQLLWSDPAGRQTYLDFVLTDAALRSELAGEIPTALAPLVVAGNLVDGRSDVAAPAKTRSPILGFLNNLPQAIQPALHPIRFFSVAALLTSVFWITVVMFIGVRGGEPGHNPLELNKPLPFTAKVLQLQQVVWSEGKSKFPTGSILDAGDELELDAGLAQVLFGDGTRAVVQGPAKLRIEDRHSLRLTTGRLLARVPASARGFVAQTPQVEVVDLGTEFGINILETETEVQVFAGSVRASRTGDRMAPGRILTTDQAAAFGVSSQGVFYAKEKTMNRSLYLTMVAALALPIAGASVESLQGAMIPVSGVTATSILDPSFPPTKTIDGSGLNVSGEHSISNNDMWLGEFGSVGQHITFELDGQYTIDSVHIWNGNYAAGLNRSLQNVQVLVSPDNNPANLVALVNPSGPSNNFLFPNGTGLATYTGFDLDLSDVTNSGLLDQVALVRFVVQSTYGNANFPTLSEVQFFGSEYVVPPGPAPEPASGAILGVGGMLVLSLSRRQRKR